MAAGFGHRYEQAYKVVNSTFNTARTMRILGFLFSAALLIAGLANGFDTVGVTLICCAIAGIIQTVVVYTLLLSQAQIMGLMCDISVNTSQHMEPTEKKRVIEGNY